MGTGSQTKIAGSFEIKVSGDTITTEVVYNVDIDANTNSDGSGPLVECLSAATPTASPIFPVGATAVLPSLIGWYRSHGARLPKSLTAETQNHGYREVEA